MKATHLLEIKQIKSIHTINLQIQQKFEAIHTTKSAKCEIKTTHSANKLINTLFCT